MQIELPVMSVLNQCRTEGNQVFLPGYLGRDLYVKTDKVLQAAGGKWNRKAKAHIFDIDAADRMDQIIITGEVDIPKDEFNFFPSPPTVVARLLKLAKLRPGMSVLEPSAGRGAIAMACADAMTKVTCVELMKANFDHLRALPDHILHVVSGDFLGVQPIPDFDRVVMNPPFMKQLDITHVMHALKFLKPGGLLVAVMSASVSFRTNSKTVDFRALVQERGGHIEALPAGSFNQSGTQVNTVIVTIPGVPA